MQRTRTRSPTPTVHVTPLADFLSRAGSLAVLCGAGVSTASGIPDYRDRNGEKKHAEPILYGDFINKPTCQQRYWARSFVGWRRFGHARPNAAHYALAKLEDMGKVDTLITQNVDRLHHDAGNRSVIELHGDLSKVRCVNCDSVWSRSDFQVRLKAANPGWHAEVFRYKPDGDAELAAKNYRAFRVPACPYCDGVMKPDVVMFGEAVPKHRVADAMSAVDRADALLVVGSSLMVFSGYRFARQAASLNKPIAIVNQGVTRADDIAALKVDEDCTQVLGDAAAIMAATSSG